MPVTVRCYADLLDLAGRAEVEVPVGTPRSVKDVIESVGVPHPEIGLAVVDGDPVGLEHLVVDGQRVAAYPPFRCLELPAEVGATPPSPRPPRFVLDVHLGRLTRRLRLLGFDCWYRRDADDVELARIAVDEHRILLTRDRGLLMRREVRWGYCPRSHDPETQALEVVDRFDLAEHAAPGTRCVHCNGPLEDVALEEVAELVPPRSRAAFDRFARCTACGRVVWPGSHLDALAGFVLAATGTDHVGNGTVGPDPRSR